MSKKTNKAFLEKIKSLTIGTGAKDQSGGDCETEFCGIEEAEVHAVCGDCGETIEKTKTKIPLAVFRRRRKPTTSAEQSFSA